MLGMVEALSREEKLRFLEALDKDLEFRYAVAGYLGLSEIIKRLDSIETHILNLYEEQTKIWSEIHRLWENQNRLWEEVKALRENQEKLWEGQNRLWEEVRELREGQEKLWEGQNRLWEEVKALRETQEKLWEEVRALREGQEKLWEGQNRLWEEVKALRENQEKLWEGQNRLWEEVRELRRDQRRLRGSFEALGEALGATIEHYACGFVKILLDEMGYPDASVGRGFVLYRGTVYQVDIFCEDPLVVGEATLYLRDRDSAIKELEKLEARIKAAEENTGRKALLKILVLANAPSEVVEYLRDECSRRGIRLMIGRELELVT